MVLGAHLVSGRPVLAFAMAVPTCLLAKHAWDVYSRIQPVKRHLIVSKDDVFDSFRDSATVKSLVNPRGHVSFGDSQFINLDLPKDARGATDEMLLAAFVRGFFGGRVFAPERAALQFVGRDLVGFKALRLDNTEVKQVWTVWEVSRHALPGLHSILFGAFQVGHVQLQQPSEDAGAPEQTKSSIDFVYGGDAGRFAGAHRFSIVRSISQPESIRVMFESTSCNPTENRPFAPAFLFMFHKIYAMFLFREGVAEILQALERFQQTTKDSSTILKREGTFTS